MKNLIILVAMWPFYANAGEAELACNLQRSIAEVQASTLSAPYAVSSIGQDATSGTKSITVGIAQSFSGRKRAQVLREAAEAKCDAIRATVALDDSGRWAAASIKREAAELELTKVQQAIRLAQRHIVQLDAQLAAQTITITQHTEARTTLVSLESRQAALLRLAAAPVQIVPITNLAQLIEQSRMSESTAARLTAQASAESGWDLVVSAGAQQQFGGQLQPYVTAAVKYSFGTADAHRAAVRVGTDTAALLAAQGGGYTQTVIRQREELTNLIQAETSATATTSRQLTHLRRVRDSMGGIDTALALNVARALDIQLLMLESDHTGAKHRLHGYQALLNQMQ